MSFSDKAVVVLQHPDPTGRVASDHDFLAVDSRIFVRLLVAKDGIDCSRQLAGVGYDGSFATQSACHGSVETMALTVLGASGSLDAMNQKGSHMSAASPSCGRTRLPALSLSLGHTLAQAVNLEDIEVAIRRSAMWFFNIGTVVRQYVWIVQNAYVLCTLNNIVSDDDLFQPKSALLGKL